MDVLHVTTAQEREEKLSCQDVLADMELKTDTDVLNVSHRPDTHGTESDKNVPVLNRIDTDQPKLKSRKDTYTSNTSKHAEKSRKKLHKHVPKGRKKKPTCVTNSEIKQDNVCDICNKTYSCRNSLMLHRHIHSGEKNFVCTTCGRAFQRYHHLSSHELTHQVNRPKLLYICDTCGMRYVDKRALRDHMAVHTGVREYFCDICGNGFWHKTGLRKHVNQVHLQSYTKRKANTCTCEICGKTLADSAALKRHMYIHTGEKEASCSICKKDFMTRHSYKRHMLRKHNPLKPKREKVKSCSICNIDFKRRSYYISHVNRKHSQLRVKRKPNNRQSKTETEDGSGYVTAGSLVRIISPTLVPSLRSEGTSVGDIILTTGSPKVHSDKEKEGETEVVSLSLSVSKTGYKGTVCGDTFSGNGVALEQPATASTTDTIRHADSRPCLNYTVSKLKTEVVVFPEEEEEDTIPYCHSPTEIKTKQQEFDMSFNIPSLLRNSVVKASTSTSVEVENVKIDPPGIKVAVSFGPDNFPSVQIKNEFCPMNNDDDDHLEPMESDL